MYFLSIKSFPEIIMIPRFWLLIQGFDFLPMISQAICLRTNIEIECCYYKSFAKSGKHHKKNRIRNAEIRKNLEIVAIGEIIEGN